MRLPYQTRRDDMLVLTIQGKPWHVLDQGQREGDVYICQAHTPLIKWQSRKIYGLQRYCKTGPYDETPCDGSSFFFKRPQLKGKEPVHKTSKPDVDNLVKTIMDTLQDAEIIKDDKCIVEIHARKWYARKGEQAHTNLMLDKSNET